MRLIQGLILSILISSCHTNYQPKAETFKLDPINEFEAPVNISIINAQTDDTDRVYVSGIAGSDTGNLKSFTDTAVSIAKRELISRQASVLDGEKRRLALSITSIEGEVGFAVIRIITKLKVTTGSGYERVYVGDNRSPASSFRAADGAVMRAIAEMLRDPEIVKYITSTEVLTEYEVEAPEIDPYMALEKLKSLYDKGILSDEEYAIKKKILLQKIE